LARCFYLVGVVKFYSTCKCSRDYRLAGFHGKKPVCTRPSFPSYPRPGPEARICVLTRIFAIGTNNNIISRILLHSTQITLHISEPMSIMDIKFLINVNKPPTHLTGNDTRTKNVHTTTVHMSQYRAQL